MRKIAGSIFFIISVLFLSGCGCIIPETIMPIYAPPVGGMTDSSIDQRCKIDVLTKAAQKVFDFYSTGEKGGEKTVFLRTVNSSSADEAADYIVRAFSKNNVVLTKYFEGASLDGVDNVLTVYPLVDGSLTSETRKKFGKERGCEVVLHARLTDPQGKKSYWVKDFSVKNFVNLLGR